MSYGSSEASSPRWLPQQQQQLPPGGPLYMSDLERALTTPWELQELRCDDQLYHVDPASRLVYEYVAADEWPGAHLLGRAVQAEGGWRVELIAGTGASTFFMDLDAELRSNLMPFSELFRRADASGDGVLQADELAALVRRFAPRMTRSEIRFMIATVDDDVDGRVSYSEFVAALKDRAEDERSGGRRMQGALQDACDYLRSRRQDVEAELRAAGYRGDTELVDAYVYCRHA